MTEFLHAATALILALIILLIVLLALGVYRRKEKEQARRHRTETFLPALAKGLTAYLDELNRQQVTKCSQVRRAAKQLSPVHEQQNLPLG